MRANRLLNKEITALFKFESYEIIFNEDWVLNVPWIEVMVTCFHETRHAYQSYSIKHGINESKDILETWKKEQANYNSPSCENKPLSDIEYLRQSIEVDVIRFAHIQIKELFNVKTIIPDIIKDLIKKHKEE